MARIREREPADDGAEIVAAKIAILKARISLAPSPWDRPEDRRDWADKVRPEIVAMVGEETADRLIEAERLREADEFRRRAETQPRGPFGPA